MKKSYKQTPKALRGIVKKSNKSRGFYVDDSKYDSQFKLGKKELFKAMPGDFVQFSLTPKGWAKIDKVITCLLYTSTSPRDRQKSRMPSSA